MWAYEDRLSGQTQQLTLLVIALVFFLIVFLFLWTSTLTTRSFFSSVIKDMSLKQLMNAYLIKIMMIMPKKQQWTKMEFLIYWHWDTANIFGFKITVKLWSKQSSQQLRLTLRSASSAPQHHQFKQKAFLEYRLPTTDRGSVNWTSDHLLYSLSEWCWFFFHVIKTGPDPDHVSHTH